MAVPNLSFSSMNERTATGVYAMTTYAFDDAGSNTPTVAGGGTYIGCFHDEKHDRVFTAAREDSNLMLTADVSDAYCCIKTMHPARPVYFLLPERHLFPQRCISSS